MIGSKIRTSYPFPSRVSARSTKGLSRRSSLPVLKLSPRIATVRTSLSITRVTTSLTDKVFVESTPERSGRSRLFIRPM